MTAKQLCDIIGMADDAIIAEALDYYPKRRIRLKFVLAAAAISALIFSTAFALNPAFREFFISVLFPAYTEESYTSIDEGHLTGSFDEDDVIMTFLSTLENDKDIKIRSESGYDYKISEITDSLHEVEVDCADEKTTIVLTVENTPYKETTGLWQVTGYKIVIK